MAILTVRNLPDEVQRALRVRAALRGRSIDAEVRAILEETLLPEGRVALGTLLTAIGRRAELEDGGVAGFAQRDAAPARPVADAVRAGLAPPRGDVVVCTPPS